MTMFIIYSPYFQTQIQPPSRPLWWLLSEWLRRVDVKKNQEMKVWLLRFKAGLCQALMMAGS